MLGLELGTGVSWRQRFEGHQLAGGGGSHGEEEELWGTLTLGGSWMKKSRDRSGRSSERSRDGGRPLSQRKSQFGCEMQRSRVRRGEERLSAVGVGAW